jgi:hypothetical protein
MIDPKFQTGFQRNEHAIQEKCENGRIYKDFTLPHRFQVDLWTPGGLQVDYLWQRVLPNYGQNPPGIHLDSTWAPDGLYGLCELHSTSCI